MLYSTENTMSARSFFSHLVIRVGRSFVMVNGVVNQPLSVLMMDLTRTVFDIFRPTTGKSILFQQIIVSFDNSYG